MCRPLVLEYGLSCLGGSAACRANIVGGKAENETSLGFPDVSVTVVNTSHGLTPQLKYLRGASCEKDKGEEASVTIDFICNPTKGLGVPNLESITQECRHAFNWETSIICPKAELGYEQGKCAIVNKNMSSEFKLNNVGANGIISVS